jgi:hypothetical protein
MTDPNREPLVPPVLAVKMNQLCWLGQPTASARRPNKSACAVLTTSTNT